MYIGRFIVIAPDFAGYRVSSRSFPNRKIVDRDGILTVSPTDEAPETDNPYISYNCCRSTDEQHVIGNGSHVDPIVEKLALGYPPRDALAHGLLAMDFEKDDYDTPRIAGILGDESYIGIVRRDGIIIETVSEPMIVATYELDRPEPIDLDVAGAEGLARALYELEYEHPVCAAGLVKSDSGADLAVYNGPEN